MTAFGSQKRTSHYSRWVLRFVVVGLYKAPIFERSVDCQMFPVDLPNVPGRFGKTSSIASLCTMTPFDRACM
jgi:hypothetical protein